MELICVPGAGGSARAYRPWAAALAPEFTIRALDLPGRGQAARETPAHVDKVLSKPPKLSELRSAFVELTA